MLIDVKIIPGARKDLVRKENASFKVYVTAPAVEGKANKALRHVLAEHFTVKKSDIKIVKGLKSRHKTIMIMHLKNK